jgi:hypothetical protein
VQKINPAQAIQYDLFPQGSFNLVLTCQFLVLTYNDQKFSTQTIYKTVNPIWNSTFDLTISHGAESELLEAVYWDKDRFRKEYLGEFGLSIAELFSEGVLSIDDPSNQVLY